MKPVLFLATLALLPLVASGAGKTLGNPQAPVRIEIFSDYECPACKELHEQTLAPLIEKYVKTGKVLLVRREFPLPMHAHAVRAARIASAAEQIGKFEQVSDQLFRTQEEWSKTGDVLGAACRILPPGEAARLRAAADSSQIAEAVESDIRAAQGEHITGTPTLIITKMIRRYPVAGPVSFPVLSRFLDSILN